MGIPDVGEERVNDGMNILKDLASTFKSLALGDSFLGGCRGETGSSSASLEFFIQLRGRELAGLGGC